MGSEGRKKKFQKKYFGGYACMLVYICLYNAYTYVICYDMKYVYTYVNRLNNMVDLLATNDEKA